MNNNITFSPKVASAFVKFQSMVKPIKKTKTVDAGGFTYAYCELSEMASAIQGTMKECDLSFYQKVSTTDDKVSVTTYLLHESGEYMEGGEFSLKIRDTHPQKMGALLSFARRYSLQTCLSLTVCSEDTDCNDMPVKEEQKQEVKESAEPKKGLEVWGDLRKDQEEGQDRVKELRHLHGRLKELGVQEDQDIRLILSRATHGRVVKRRDARYQDLKMVNELLGECTAIQIQKILSEMKKIQMTG